MATIQQYKDCSTAGLRLLDLQLISQIERIAPGVLVRFDHLPVQIGAGCHPYLQAPAVRGLTMAIARRQQIMIVNSAYRTIAQQAALFAHFQNRRCGIKAAARPGSSNHNTGLSLDIEDAQGWRQYLERNAWDWIGSFDPMHFDYCGQGCKDLRWLSIKAFQQLWNFNNPLALIAEDGAWGLQTYQALAKTSTAGFKHVPGKVKEMILPATTSVGMPSLRQGMRGDAIKVLQQALIRHNYQVSKDGIYGAATVAAVKAFQEASGLDADGVVGAATKKALKLT